MRIARSKVTAQGRISVPAKVRKRLGIGPGSVLEWGEKGGEIVVRCAGRYTSQEMHAALFPVCAPQSRSLKELKQGIRAYVRKKHACN
jgi:AbrB family looped-hinge helix DNA binding protein